MLHSLSKKECEVLCSVDPERCQTDCKGMTEKVSSEEPVFATATLILNENEKGGLGDCNLWNCQGYIWQLCCAQPGVLPHQPCWAPPDCGTTAPICSC